MRFAQYALRSFFEILPLLWDVSAFVSCYKSGIGRDSTEGECTVAQLTGLTVVALDE